MKDRGHVSLLLDQLAAASDAAFKLSMEFG